MARHSQFVIVADIKAGFENHLRMLDPNFQPPAPLPALPPPDFSKLEMLHYASFVVYDAERLATTQSKLVFECSVDGPAGPFLNKLVADPNIDGIFSLCEGYVPGSDRNQKLAFLNDRLKRPELFHAGAPRRSVQSIKEDLALRHQLDDHLDRLMAPTLTNYRSGTPPGMREYGLFDAISPWLAWVVGIVVPVLALLGILYVRVQPLGWLTKLSTAIFEVVISLIAIVAGFKMWIGMVPGVRNRAAPWVGWTFAGVAVAFLASVLWRGGQHRWALVIAGLYLAGLAVAVYLAYRHRGDEQLRLIRSNLSGLSVVATWKALKRQVPRGDGIDWLQLASWLWWPAAWGGFYLVFWRAEPHRWRLIIGLTILFLLKGLWLAVLLGWPAKEAIRQDKARIFAFIAALPAAAFGAFFVLIRLGLGDHPGFLAAVVLGSIFSLWAIPLPSPTPKYLPVDQDLLRKILDDEDHDAVNHMSAVVVLNQDHRYRVWVLKSFLFLLKWFYYRSWLPNIYRGKLFGVPTVHFAQWVLIDNRNFLFLSNYDSSWTSYLDDFGLTLTTGIQKIWGQGVNNPGTKDLARFKEYARTTMVQHSYWYRAYPDLTLRQVWNNEQIRRAIDKARDEAAMMSALERFGAAKKILPDIRHARTL